MKASGSVASLLQGVSQQIPEERGAGQHTEQINMLPDPVQGLSRRHGTRFVAERQTTLDPLTIDQMTADTDNWRTFTYSNAGHDYVVLYRAATRPVGSPLPPVQVYDRTTATWLTVTRPVTDTQLDALETGGISALTSIGKYVFMAGFNTATTASTVDLWDNATNLANSVVWIRGGTYARKFSVTATKTDNTQITFTYTTPTSAYPGTLDTSGVPVYAADPAGGTTSDTEAAYITNVGGVGVAKLSWASWTPTAMSMKNGATAMTNVSPAAPVGALQYAWAAGASTATFDPALVGSLTVTMTYTHVKTVTNPNYSKNINDLTNAFNSAVTNWIGTAAAAIAPDAIAEQLRLAAVAAGLAPTRISSTLAFTNVKALVVSDGGDGSLIRGVAQEVTSIDQVSDIHLVGKVVRVRAANSAESFYLKAIPKDPLVTSGYTQVTWVEGSALKYSITNSLLYLTVSAGVAYMASTATLLNSVLPGTHPDYVASTVGDAETSPLPFFVGKQITYLGVFQDRLMVGAGAVLRCSKVGDYLNFFRTSVLTVPADDTLEVLAQGSDDDTLRYGVIYNRDLVIFGEKQQYIISGKAVLTPTAPNMAIMSAHAAAAQLPPIAIGGQIFYGQLGEVGSAVFQVQPGIVVDSPESFIASSQVDTYLSGRIIEFANNAKPTHLLARTTGDRSSIFCFTYLDKAQSGRVQDAWHKLAFAPALGKIIGMARVPSGVEVYFLRTAKDFSGVLRTYLVTDMMVFTSGLATYPYLDSIRTLAAVQANTGSTHTLTAGDWKVAFDSSSVYRFQGDTLANYSVLLMDFPLGTGPQVGIDQPTLFIPTNPFVEDKNGKVITIGTLTVSNVLFKVANSSGFWADVTSATRGTTDSIEYSARIANSPDNLIGRETVTNLTLSVPISLPTTDYTLGIRARSWLPLTITQIEWVGQWFNRPQRI